MKGIRQKGRKERARNERKKEVRVAASGTR